MELDERLFSVAEVAQLKGVTPRAVYEAEKTGAIQTVRTASGAKVFLFCQCQVEHYLRIKPGRPCKSPAVDAK